MGFFERLNLGGNEQTIPENNTEIMNEPTGSIEEQYKKLEAQIEALKLDNPTGIDIKFLENKLFILKGQLPKETLQ
jgi:hypothetical protein